MVAGICLTILKFSVHYNPTRQKIKTLKVFIGYPENICRIDAPDLGDP